MNQKEVNPAITKFVVFSGGGGLITRQIEVDLESGTNKITIREVPSSFDPETLNIDFEPRDVKLREFVIKKPNRQYVEDNLRREGVCAQKLIHDSVELGSFRPEILEICESVSLRTYLDEEVYLVLWLDTEEKKKVQLTLSYFIDDARFRWKPTLIVEMDENSNEAKLKGLIAITNESARCFGDVEVSFADFAKDMQDDSLNFRGTPEQMKMQMKQQPMKMCIL